MQGRVCAGMRGSLNFPKLRGSCRGTLGDRYYCVILHHNPSALPSIEIGWCIADTALTTCGGNTSSHFSVPPKCASTSLALLYLQSQSSAYWKCNSSDASTKKRTFHIYIKGLSLSPLSFVLTAGIRYKYQKNKKKKGRITSQITVGPRINFRLMWQMASYLVRQQSIYSSVWLWQPLTVNLSNTSLHRW